jgi:hypothetical protein
MFNRGKNDKSDGSAYAQVTLDDGHELKGRFTLTPGRTLPEMLNNASAFIEFEPFDGERILIAKSALQSIKQKDAPGVPNLLTGSNSGFDPFAVLRIDRDAGAEEARRAYLGLSKIYHPDRFATVALPPEVMSYLAAMASRVNAAYDEVQDAIKRREELAPRQEPVFTKTGQS